MIWLDHTRHRLNLRNLYWLFVLFGTSFFLLDIYVAHFLDLIKCHCLSEVKLIENCKPHPHSPCIHFLYLLHLMQYYNNAIMNIYFLFILTFVFFYLHQDVHSLKAKIFVHSSPEPVTIIKL